MRYRKPNILLLFLFVSIIFFNFVIPGSRLFAQHSFTFICRDDTFRYLQPFGWADYRFRLENTGALRDSYELKILVIESVPGWYAQICARGRCVEPGIPMIISLSPGEDDTTIVAHIYTNHNSGREKVTVSCRSLGDTTLKREQNLYAQVGLGIEERPVHWDREKEVRVPLRVFTITGQLVKSPLRQLKEGIYFIPETKRKLLIIK